MTGTDLLSKLKDAIVNLDFDGAPKLAQDAIQSGIPATEIIAKGIGQAMDEVGKKFESSEYFLSELIVAGEISKEVTQLLQPYLKGAKIKKLGKVAIATVRGDLHDIGKNIFGMMLESAGFEVIDLGSDVPPETFVETAKNDRPDVIGMSALLTVTMVEMEGIIKALETAGLRKNLKIIVGGAPLTEDFAKRIGADAYARDAVVGVEVCKKWVGA